MGIERTATQQRRPVPKCIASRRNYRQQNQPRSLTIPHFIEEEQVHREWDLQYQYTLTDFPGRRMVNYAREFVAVQDSCPHENRSDVQLSVAEEDLQDVHFMLTSLQSYAGSRVPRGAATHAGCK